MNFSQIQIHTIQNQVWFLKRIRQILGTVSHLLINKYSWQGLQSRQDRYKVLYIPRLIHTLISSISPQVTVWKFQKFTITYFGQKLREIRVFITQSKLSCMQAIYTKEFSIENKFFIFPHCASFSLIGSHTSIGTDFTFS